MTSNGSIHDRTMYSASRKGLDSCLRALCGDGLHEIVRCNGDVTDE